MKNLLKKKLLKKIQSLLEADNIPFDSVNNYKEDIFIYEINYNTITTRVIYKTLYTEHLKKGFDLISPLKTYFQEEIPGMINTFEGDIKDGLKLFKNVTIFTEHHYKFIREHNNLIPNLPKLLNETENFFIFKDNEHPILIDDSNVKRYSHLITKTIDEFSKSFNSFYSWNLDLTDMIISGSKIYFPDISALTIFPYFVTDVGGDSIYSFTGPDFIPFINETYAELHSMNPLKLKTFKEVNNKRKAIDDIFKF